MLDAKTMQDHLLSLEIINYLSSVTLSLSIDSIGLRNTNNELHKLEQQWTSPIADAVA